MVAELTLINLAPRNLIKKTLAPTDKRIAVDYLVGEEYLLIRVACDAIELARYLLQEIGLAKGKGSTHDERLKSDGW